MPKEFRFPDIGEGIQEGEIVKWIVKEGDHVEEHQVMGEVETDKAVAEIPSPYSGKVLKLNFREGETVKVGQVLFVIGEEGETYEHKPEVKTDVKGPQFKAAGAVGYLEEASDEIKPRTVVSPSKTISAAVMATPLVRALAKALNVDLSNVKGTGPEGRITEQDVKNSIGQKPVTQEVRQETEVKQEVAPVMKVTRKYDMWGYVDHIPLKGIRKAIARHMVESVKHIPHVTTMDDADVTKLSELRDVEKIKAQEQGIKLTYLPFIMKACIEALKEYPLLNSTLDEENEDIIVKKYYNIGFAVDVDGEGLVVPVIKGSDKKSIFDIAEEMQELADKARAKKLDLQDMRGGTFSITNYGSFGGKYATPIINYPESAILGLGRIYETPLVVDGKVEIRKVLPISFVFDHRIADGAYATKFLNSFILKLEDPESLV